MSCNLKLPWWQPVNVISLFFWGTPSQRQALFAFILILYSLHWVEESEVFGWSHNRSRIPNNSRSRIQILYPTPEAQLDHFLHHTLKLGIPVEMVQFLMKLLLKQRIQAVYHDFHWLLLATKLFTAKLHSLYVKGSESGVGIFGKVEIGVGVGHFTSDSATPVCILVDQGWRLGHSVKQRRECLRGSGSLMSLLHHLTSRY